MYEAVDGSLNTFSSEIRPDLVDASQAIYFELAPNHCSLHDGRIIHGAEANTSPRRRAGYTLRFSMEMKLNLEAPGNKQHKIWLSRGQNVAGNPVEDRPII